LPAQPASKILSIPVPKPRNAVLQAAALGQVKLGTAKHEKSKGALRRAEKMALQKATKTQAES
jgi:hypothetical protein